MIQISTVDSRTLNYRAPRDDARLAQIESQLRKREAGFWMRVVVKFATGVPVLLLGPAIGGIIVQGLLSLAKSSFQPGYLACYGIACLIIIPILFLIEIRSHGEFYFNEARFYHSPGDTPTTSLHYMSGGSNTMEVGAAYIEVLLFAPRQILSAIADMKQRTPISGDELRRAAQIVRALDIADGGVPLEQLGLSPDSEESFARVLRYLQFYDWIDLSKKRDRVWLMSDAKKWLQPAR